MEPSGLRYTHKFVTATIGRPYVGGYMEIKILHLYYDLLNLYGDLLKYGPPCPPWPSSIVVGTAGDY